MSDVHGNEVSVPGTEKLSENGASDIEAVLIPTVFSAAKLKIEYFGIFWLLKKKGCKLLQ